MAITYAQFAESVRRYLIDSGLSALTARKVIEEYADALVEANAAAWDTETVGDLLIKLESKRIGVYAARNTRRGPARVREEIVNRRRRRPATNEEKIRLYMRSTRAKRLALVIREKFPDMKETEVQRLVRNNLKKFGF
jgi:hypothetical protein